MIMGGKHCRPFAWWRDLLIALANHSHDLLTPQSVAFSNLQNGWLGMRWSCLCSSDTIPHKYHSIHISETRYSSDIYPLWAHYNKHDYHSYTITYKYIQYINTLRYTLHFTGSFSLGICYCWNTSGDLMPFFLASWCSTTPQYHFLVLF